jgi:SAM-dependent methyltransferase
MPDARRQLKNAIIDVRKLLRMFRHLDREAVAVHYLAGEGIEIGALHNPLIVPSGARVRYVDRMPVNELRTHYPELVKKDLVHVDIVDDGERLTTIGNASQDFVIANHFLEHCEDPLRTLEHHFRVLKEGAVLFLALPDKRYTFDSPRAVTPFEHLERDYREGPAWSRDRHYLEWAELVDRLTDPAAIRARADELQRLHYSIHFHVWTMEDMVDLLRNLPRLLAVRFSIEFIMRNEGEVNIVLCKSKGTA